MRDIGRMGESAFSQWCASAGLTANNSNVDKTGWDFFVEFDFHSNANSEFSTVHEAAFECKVQVKSTDKNDRRLAIKLSNLKRLATASMPAFFVFVEFDGKDEAQRVFLVHVDQDLCSKILRRLHDAEQQDDQLHKKTMIVKYDETHLLSEISGSSLVTAMRRHMGISMSEYVNKKNAHLRSVGFEDGFAELIISANGVEDISRLIDLSIGLQDDAGISELTVFKKRFGKKSADPFMRHKGVKMEMPDLKPTHEGTLRLKADKIGPAYSLPAKIYFSPFNSSVPPELRKGRISTDFFDLVFNLFANTCTYTYSYPTKRHEIGALRNGLKLLELFSTPGQCIYSEVVADNLLPLKFNVNSTGLNFLFSRELAAIEAAQRVLSLLSVCNPVQISMGQVTRYASRMLEMDQVLGADAKTLRIQIPAVEVVLQEDKDLICLTFFSTPIGDIWIGVFVTIVGKPIFFDDATYNIFATTRTIERVVVREKNEELSSDDLIAAASAIEQAYENEHEVATLFDKSLFHRLAGKR